jgi:hypothetical protein
VAGERKTSGGIHAAESEGVSGRATRS